MLQNKLLPLLLDPWTTIQGTALGIRPLPGTQGTAPVRSGWTRTSLKTLEDLMRHVSGIEGTPLGPIDFTGAWHGEEVLSVFRPGLTFAIDPKGRRWIAEMQDGHLGPVWCAFAEPGVVVYVSDSLEDFFRTLRRHLHFDTFAAWMKRLEDAAQLCWQHRGALAYHARGDDQDAQVRQWLLRLPRDARVYDLRTPHFGSGFPYGAAGPTGELHRCGSLRLFAVSGFPAPARWSNYLGELVTRTHIPRPGIVCELDDQGGGRAAPAPRA